MAVYTRVVSGGPGVFVPGPPNCDFGAGFREAGGVLSIDIQPVGAVTRDALGQLLHVVARFPALNVSGFGRHVQWALGWSDGSQGKPIDIETDPGSYYFQVPVQIGFTGGTLGDIYTVAIIEGSHLPELEDARELRLLSTDPPLLFEYALTTVCTGRDIPISVPLGHTDVWCVAGAPTYEGIVLPVSSHRLPTNAANIVCTSNSILKTGGQL